MKCFCPEKVLLGFVLKNVVEEQKIDWDLGDWINNITKVILRKNPGLS